MEPLNQKTLEKVLSQRAIQMSNSFPCQICVMSFICGVCIASLFLAALTSFGTFELGGISSSVISAGPSPWNTSSRIINMVTTEDCRTEPKQIEGGINNSQDSNQQSINERVSLLYSAWSDLLKAKSGKGDGELFEKAGLSKSNLPNAPHFENCKSTARLNERLDKREENENFPPWTIWRGLLDMYPSSANDEHLRDIRRQSMSGGAYPPWIMGSDEENFPLTRKVQRDIWVHQHPLNCRDPSVKFLVADWERLPGFGIGAQIAGMIGLLALAINENRVLVTNYFNRADHDGCKAREWKGVV